ASRPGRRSPCRWASASSRACTLPSDHRDWNALAWTYLQSGQSELALEAARRAHQGNRNNLDYLNTLGVAYGEMGELERAESSFRKVLKRKPVFLDALVNLAKTLEKQERFADAIPHYERALALDETYPKLTANLARLYRERILLCGEQGLGDVLFFLRFAPLLRARGARLSLACERKLHGVIATGGVLDAVVESGAEGVWLGDLPALLECEETPPAWPL